MRIVCHYAALHLRTRESLASYSAAARFVDTSGSETAYWESVASMWNMGDDLMLVEQDIEIHAAVVGEFLDCPALWCVFPYSLGSSVRETASIVAVVADGSRVAVEQPPGCIHGNGCTRYRFQAQRLVTPAQVQEETPSRWGWGNWRDLDTKLSGALLRRGLSPHVHQPNVEHWHGDARLLFPQLGLPGSGRRAAGLG